MSGANPAAQMEALVEMLNMRANKVREGRDSDMYKVQELQRKILGITEEIQTKNQLVKAKQKLLRQLNNQYDSFEQQIKNLSNLASKMQKGLERLNQEDKSNAIDMGNTSKK
jgi:chromosome segregation ATPase